MPSKGSISEELNLQNGTFMRSFSPKRHHIAGVCSNFFKGLFDLQRRKKKNWCVIAATTKIMVSREHARGALLGLFVGDAAGATLEFSCGKITEKIARAAMRMPGGGALSVGPGQVTDDSELAMALARALATRNPKGGLPMDAIARAYRAWYESNPFDVGGTCSAAFASSSSSSDAAHQGLGGKMIDDNAGIARAMRAAAAESSSGSEANGALMRIVPMAIWLAGQPWELIASGAKEDSLLSHPNPVCQECNAVYVLTIAHLLTHPGDQQGALDLAEHYAHHHMVTRAKHWLLVDSLDISHLDCTFMIGHVRYAFTLAFFFLRQAASYEDAIALTLQKGGDTDTNAAIVGGMLGGLNGAERIPSFMKDPVLSFDCSHADRVSRKGHPRPAAYSTKHMEELLVGLLSSNESM